MDDKEKKAKNMHRINDKSVSTTKAAHFFGVTAGTIRSWDAKGYLQSYRTSTGHRRIILPDSKDIQKFTAQQSQSNTTNSGLLIQPEEKQSICYCRVSSKHQQDDLQRQVSYMQQKFPTHKIITDIGSGINWKRHGFNSILESAKNGNLKELVIAHRDRLCRFAFELVQNWLELCGVTLVVLDKEKFSYEQELSDDILSILQVFIAKKNGSRRYSKNQSNDT